MRLSLILLILCCGSVLYIDQIFYKKDFEIQNFPDQKFWRHRGGNPENSISGILETIATEKYGGVELDAHFNEGEFWISHDFPSTKTFSLKELIDQFESKTTWLWLDFKNLSESNLDQALSRLKEINYPFLLVESNQRGPLQRLAKSGLKTIYWLNPHAKSRIRWFRSLWNKLMIGASDFSGYSIYYSQYEKSIQQESYLKNIPVFLFTVEERETLKKYQHQEHIKVILTKNEQGLLNE